ncbi:NAD-dependent epimerase/dehydratase family protein [Ornithinimicrobium cavernae]|uniref:NAD-dependent epimerase/dehydratase family protein n=1 Tax=Ornithinimicrobium cavernae TaxID=2666047 RepID=UPI000D698DF8|nr:NAD-dependent epimerase/dehydratase family protein [Ornithinimicrobium cavernae]
MKFLIFGGSVFLSRHVAEVALARGHKVVCLSRGDSGAPPKGAHHIVADRSEETDPRAGTWTGLASHEWDAVIDVARTPSWVETALAALKGQVAHWTFVSTINVYSDLSVAGGTPKDTPLHEPAPGDLDDSGDSTAYGRNKVACEQAVQREMEGRCLIARPGLIAGPGDPSGRYTYWPERLSRGGRVLVPEPADAPTQLIDVRDLAEWLVTKAEERATGTFDTVRPAMPFHQFLEETAAAVAELAPDGREDAPPVRFVWADPDELLALDVRPWSGPRSLPLWLPDPEYAGMRARDVSATLAAGLALRPLAETARDTLRWISEGSGTRKAGLTWSEEQDVLSSLNDPV